MMFGHKNPSATALPPQLTEMLDGSDLEAKTTLVFQLLTVDEQGWPHVALLSVGEIYAPAADQMMIGLWPGTRTSGNLRRDGRGLLVIVADGAAYKLRLRCAEVAGAATDAGRVAVFRATIDDVSRDSVTYAELISGPQIHLTDDAATAARWRETVQLMKQLRADAG